MANSLSEITMVRGDTDPFILKFWADRKAGTVYDLSDVTSAVMTVDPEKDPADAANNVFSVNGVIADPTSGEISFSISEVQADITPGTYYYDVQFTKTGGYKKTPIKDKFIVTQDITKA